MRKNKPIYYWDTCIFIAWLKGEVRPNNEMEGVRYIAEEVHKDNAFLITSNMTQSEILQCTLDENARKLYTSFFKRRNVREVATDNRVWSLTHNIRDYYQQQKNIDNLPTLATPDAVHLASAIINNVNEFHTFDTKNTSKRRALIPLNGNVAGHKLIICKPPLPIQRGLF